MVTNTALHRLEELKRNKVETIIAQMANLVLDMRNRPSEISAAEKPVRNCLAHLTPFLGENGPLTLIVQEDTLLYGERVVYCCTDKRDSLAHALFRDGIRAVTFKAGLTCEELSSFLCAFKQTREADPRLCDLVTTLWEKDLLHITWRSVDPHLGKDIGGKVNRLIQRCAKQARNQASGSVDPDAGFFVSDLGISMPAKAKGPGGDSATVSEPDLRALFLESLDDDDRALIKQCSEICLEVTYSSEYDDLFCAAVGFLGKACEWLVSMGDFVWAASILLKLRSQAGDQEGSSSRAAAINDVIARLGERQNILCVKHHLKDLTESRIEEIYGYLTLMAPVAIAPLCEMLTHAGAKSVRYLLCRALSIIGREDMSQIVRYIKDKRWYVARNMVMISGMMETPEAIPVLRHALSNPEPRVRKELARALGRIGSPEGLEMLEALFDDEDKRVRLASIRAAREIGGEPAIEVLENAIAHKNFRKRPLDERKEMMIAFGSLGRESLALLKAVLEGKVHRWDKKTQACAAYGLARIGDEDAVKLLREAVEKGSGSIRYAAAEAYAGIKRISNLGFEDDK